MADKQRVLILPLVILLASLAVTVGIVRSRPQVERSEPPAPVPLVRVQEARPQVLQLVVRSRGTVEAATAATLVSEVAGKVEWVAPRFATGGFFAAGEPLLRLDRRDYELALTRARANKAQADVRLIQVQAEAEIAAQEWSELGAGEAPPLVLRQPQVAEAEAAVLAAEAAVEAARLDLSRSEIRAPYAGRVREKQADVGQYLAPGQPVAAIYGVAEAEVRLPVADAELAYLDLDLADRDLDEGPAVELSAQFAGELRRWSGTIVRSGGEIDPRTRMVNLIARVADPYGRREGVVVPPLAVGMFVDAEIRGVTVEGVVALPRSALRRSEDGENRVLVVEDGERLRYRRVEVLRLMPEQVLIRSGLAAGEEICVSPLETPVDGMAVRTVVQGAVAAEVRPESGR